MKINLTYKVYGVIRKNDVILLFYACYVLFPIFAHAIPKWCQYHSFLVGGVNVDNVDNFYDDGLIIYSSPFKLGCRCKRCSPSSGTKM